jgi:hypothetical protein
MYLVSAKLPKSRYVDEIPEISDYQYTKYQKVADIVDVRGVQMAVDK